jgi:hypothetical protein
MTTLTCSCKGEKPLKVSWFFTINILILFRLCDLFLNAPRKLQGNSSSWHSTVLQVIWQCFGYSTALQLKESLLSGYRSFLRDKQSFSYISLSSSTVFQIIETPFWYNTVLLVTKHSPRSSIDLRLQNTFLDTARTVLLVKETFFWSQLRFTN